MSAVFSGSEDPLQFRQMLAVKKSLTRSLLLHGAVEAAPLRADARLAAENIQGTGIAEKTVEGRPTGELAINIYVREKVPSGENPLKRIRPGFVIEPKLKGFPTDVEEVGQIVKRAANTQVRIRPAVPGGVSTGLPQATTGFVYAGTLGCLVRSMKGKTGYALSNNHVFADENRAPGGSPILQPGTLDGGAAGDQVAKLSRFVRLRFGRVNTVDAALARPVGGIRIDRSVLGLGRVNGSRQPSRGMRVRKTGRTTGTTQGVVLDVVADIKVQYDQGIALFTNQTSIKGMNGIWFSRGGDSGSVILEKGTNSVVGLLFAGSDTQDITFANKPKQLNKTLKIIFPKA